MFEGWWIFPIAVGMAVWVIIKSRQDDQWLAEYRRKQDQIDRELREIQKSFEESILHLESLERDRQTVQGMATLRRKTRSTRRV